MKFYIDVQKKWDGDTFRMTILPKVEYRSIREAALFCQGQAVLLCPWDSGRLRSSISVKFRGQKAIRAMAPVDGSETDDVLNDEPAENTAHVGSNVIYAAAQEFGMPSGYGKYKGPGFAPQPYLRPAADITEGKSVTIIEQGGKQEFEKYKGLK